MTTVAAFLIHWWNTVRDTVVWMVDHPSVAALITMVGDFTVQTA